jgi:hypothetical protein
MGYGLVRISAAMVGISLNSSLRRQSYGQSQLDFGAVWDDGECSVEFRKEPVRIVVRSGSAEGGCKEL